MQSSNISKGGAGTSDCEGLRCREPAGVDDSYGGGALGNVLKIGERSPRNFCGPTLIIHKTHRTAEISGQEVEDFILLVVVRLTCMNMNLAVFVRYINLFTGRLCCAFRQIRVEL